METLAHNKFLQYRPGVSVRMEGEHARLFIEPKGHGISAFTGHTVQLKESVNGVIEYTFAGGGDEPKTGDTKAAGNCLLFEARSHGVTLIGVVLHASPTANPGSAIVAARRLLNWGFVRI